MALVLQETQNGSIKIRSAVIGRIIIKAVERFNGRVKITNHKGKVVRLKDKYGIPVATDFFEINMNNEGMDLRFYVAIRFGTSIGSVTEKLINEIKSDIEKMTGIETNSIAVVVTGLITKKITRRNIEVRG